MASAKGKVFGLPWGMREDWYVWVLLNKGNRTSWILSVEISVNSKSRLLHLSSTFCLVCSAPTNLFGFGP